MFVRMTWWGRGLGVEFDNCKIANVLDENCGLSCWERVCESDWQRFPASPGPTQRNNPIPVIPDMLYPYMKRAAGGEPHHYLLGVPIPMNARDGRVTGGRIKVERFRVRMAVPLGRSHRGPVLEGDWVRGAQMRPRSGWPPKLKQHVNCYCVFWLQYS